MVMKKYLVLCTLCLVVSSTYAQLKVHTFEEVEQLSQEHPKPIVVFFHTDWCKFCSLMLQTTFKNEAIVDKLNKDFYFISFNAESKDPVNYHNQIYRFRPTGTGTGIHELATVLASSNGQLIYPTSTILSVDQSIIFQQHSVIRPKELLLILNKANN
jgi:thioredoxin-related protein